MSAAPQTVESNELAFFFQTNEPVPARPLLDFLNEIDRIARSRRHLGPDAVVEIVEVITGTKLVRMTFSRKVALISVGLAGASLAVAVAQLGNDLAERIQQPSGRLADSAARLCLDHGVVECVITTPEGQVHISRDTIEAVSRLRDRREAPQLEDVGSKRLSGKFGSGDETVLMEPIQDIRAASPVPAGEGRIYTLVGRLHPPVTGSRDWQFVSQSGTAYIARGVNPDRANLPEGTIVVIRAEVWGRQRGTTVLHVKDVFEPEEP